MAKEVNVNALIKTESGLDIKQVQKFFTATPKDKVLSRPAKGGGQWDYVAGSYVTQVLNSLFGFKWSFEVLTGMEDAFKVATATGTVVVQGRLKVLVGDEWIVKEQYGRKDVAFKKGTKEPLDFGNDMKAAATDAKKKCASELGLFADVYSKEDFFEATLVQEVDGGEVVSEANLLDEIKAAKTVDELKAIMAKTPLTMKRALTPVIENRIKELTNE